MANTPDRKPKDGSFLGGGPKFNQAGLNTPLPGERVSEGDTPPPFGGPRIWIGALVIVILVVLLYAVYAGGLGGVRQTFTPRGGGISDHAPSANPDSP